MNFYGSRAKHLFERFKREQNVPELSLFDVIIDWCLLDAMDDQANPPASITSVLANRWLGNDYKRTGMTTAVWSYIKSKTEFHNKVD